MKRLILFTILAVGTAQLATAQYNRMNRMNRSSRMSSIPNPRTDPEPEELNPKDIVADRLPEYQETFKLDNFEIEVLRTYLEDHFTKVIALQKNESLNAEGMRKAYEQAEKDFKHNLSSILEEAEVEQLIAMDFSPRAQRKRKKQKDNK